MIGPGGSANQQAAPGQLHPIVEEVAVHTSTAAFTHVVDYPTETVSGELLYAFCGVDGREPITAPAGWTQHNTSPYGTDIRADSWYKVADGTEGGTTGDWLTTDSEPFAAQIFRISTWSGSTADLLLSREPNVYNADTVFTGWGSFAVLWLNNIIGSMSNTYISHPAGYADLVTTMTGIGTSEIQIYTCRVLNKASEESPGAWSFSGTSGRWYIFSVSVKGAIAT